MQRPLYVVLIILFALSLSQRVVADDKTTVENLLKERIDKVLSVLQQKGLKSAEKDRQILDIVTPIFDFPLMAKLTLGRKYWPGLSKDQRERFKDAFIKHLKTSYLGKLNLYSDQTVAYKPPIEVEARKKVYVPIDVISKGSTIPMLYKFWKSRNGWKIYDLEISGVSIIQSYRTQFDEVLRNGTFEDLLKEIKKMDTK